MLRSCGENQRRTRSSQEPFIREKTCSTRDRQQVNCSTLALAIAELGWITPGRLLYPESASTLPPSTMPENILEEATWSRSLTVPAYPASQRSFRRLQSTITCAFRCQQPR